MKVVGIDGALNHWGIAIGTYDNNKLKITKVDHLAYKRNPKLKRGLADVERIKKINEVLRGYVEDADLIAAELLGGSRSASAAWSLGAALGIIASLTDGEIVWVTPYEAKKVTGNGRASKEKVIKWATTKYPNINWRRYRGKITKTNEHAADAIAILTAALDGKGYSI